MSAEPSTMSFLRRRGLLTAVFALAACDGDSTPIVKEGGESLQLAPTNAPGGGLRPGGPATAGPAARQKPAHPPRRHAPPHVPPLRHTAHPQRTPPRHDRHQLLTHTTPRAH